MQAALYHFWSAPQAQRVRLALGYKRIPVEDHALAYDDDETFFELGIARKVPVLRLSDGRILTDSVAILREIDVLFPAAAPLVGERIDPAAWQALLEWRGRVDAILERLHAAARPAYRDIGANAQALAAYKSEVRHRFGMSLEALANDRYAGYSQFDAQTQLGALARHLACAGFYMGGQPSIADMLLAADLYPLQLLDGISLPIDLMYYLARVEAVCATRLDEGLLAPL
jgi:glutathione S-transferase